MLFDYSAYQNPESYVNKWSEENIRKAGIGAVVAAKESLLLPRIENLDFHAYIENFELYGEGQTPVRDFYDSLVIGNPIPAEKVKSRWHRLNVKTSYYDSNSDPAIVKKALAKSLNTLNSLVIYISHTMYYVQGSGKTKKVTAADLNPSKKRGADVGRNDLITSEELTAMINHKEYRASIFLIAGCSSNKSVKKIHDNKKIVIGLASGPDFLTKFHNMTDAITIFLDNLTGYHIVRSFADPRTPLKIPIKNIPLTVENSLIEGNKIFPISESEDTRDRFQILNGDEKARFF